MTKKNTEELLEDITLEDAGRRKAVKTIVGGVTALAAYNVFPSKWGTPIIEQVFLPAHAATSGIEQVVTFNLTVSSNSVGTCSNKYQDVTVNGTVWATDGRDLTGVAVNIHYTDDPASTAYDDNVVTVQTGNVFSSSEGMIAGGENWIKGPHLIVVTFVDQASYGTASASTTGTCKVA